MDSGPYAESLSRLLQVHFDLSVSEPGRERPPLYALVNVPSIRVQEFRNVPPDRKIAMSATWLGW